MAELLMKEMPDVRPLLMLQSQLYKDFSFGQIDGVLEGKAASQATEMMAQCQPFFVQMQNLMLNPDASDEERQEMVLNNMVCLYASCGHCVTYSILE